MTHSAYEISESSSQFFTPTETSEGDPSAAFSQELASLSNERMVGPESNAVPYLIAEPLTTSPNVAVDGLPPVSIVEQPLVSDGGLPQASDVEQSLVSDGQQPMASDVDQALVSDSQQPMASVIDQALVSDGQQPTASGIDQVLASDGQQPNASGVDQTPVLNVGDVQQQPVSDIEPRSVTDVGQPSVSHDEQPQEESGGEMRALASTLMDFGLGTAAVVGGEVITGVLTKNPKFLAMALETLGTGGKMALMTSPKFLAPFVLPRVATFGTAVGVRNYAAEGLTGKPESWLDSANHIGFGSAEFLLLRYVSRKIDGPDFGPTQKPFI